MSPTFAEAGGNALIERFKRELKHENVELTAEAEQGLTELVHQLLSRNENPQALLGDLYQQMPRYVGLVVARGLVGRRSANILGTGPVVVGVDDVRLALAECPLCRGPTTRARSIV